jgi:tetratricopeptide (TPR) repeat protein
MTARAFSAPRPPGRNDPCPCGSGRKFKHCCAGKPPEPAPPIRLAEAELRRGQELERQGRLDEAMIAFRVAALEWPEADSRLGHILAGYGRRAEAAHHFRAAAGAAPANLERRMDLVRAHLFEGDTEGAKVELRRLVADDPANGDALWLLGRLLTEAGDFAEAADLYARVIEKDPARSGVYYDLVRIRTLTEADRPMIGAMLAAVRGTNLAEDRAKLHLALAKAFDDLGDYGSAMNQILQANQVRSPLARFDRLAVTRHTDAVIERFDEDFIASRVSHGDPSTLPMMIVGLPRSGTTLMEQILSSHPAVAGAGELNFWSTRDPLLNPKVAEAWLDRYQAETAREALAMLRDLAPGAAHVIDKNPFNFLWLGPIHLTFPRAMIIHCRRHPIDTCLSMAFTHLAARSDLPVDLADLVFYHRQYERMMAHWRAVLPPDRFIEVDYEALVADPEPIARRLIAALDLPWDPACLSPERNTRAVKTNSTWQVRQPIYRGSVERWRRYEPWLGPLRELVPVR